MTGNWSSGFSEEQLGAQLKDLALAFLGADAISALDAQRLVDYAAEQVPHAIDAALTLIRGEQRPETLAASGELAMVVDSIQYDTGQGPCLEAIANHDLTRANHLESDQRWPKFCAQVVEQTPVRSMFGVRLVLPGNDRGALNFYATEENAFTDLDLGVGAVLATLSSLTLQNSIERQRAGNLEIALNSGRQIGMAMGILMASHLLTADQAFDALRSASQRLHVKLRDVAATVTETGELPSPSTLG
jgi:ANTAR domain/GAF domain